ncbi:MAG: carboxypeptidase-like regulatory domain-containing protein [Bacteroidota bacterium]
MKKFVFIAVALFFAAQLSFGQKTVTGKVYVKSNGKAVSGATIKIKEKPTVTTKTLADGTYTITVPPVGKTLIVEAAGYLKQEQLIENKKSVDFGIEPDSSAPKNQSGTTTPTN